MTDPAQRLLDAQAAATAARARVNVSMAQLQAKLNPKRIAQRAVRDAADVGSVAAEVSVDTARRYPATLVGLVAAAGLFLARHRIAYLLRRAPGATDHDDAS